MNANRKNGRAFGKPPRKDKGKTMRFLSWLVLWVCGSAACCVIEFLCKLAVNLGFSVFQSCNSVFWAIIILQVIIVIALGVLVVFVRLAASLSCAASSAIRHSNSGWRYIVFSIFHGLWCLLLIVGLLAGVIRANSLSAMISIIAWIVFALDLCLGIVLYGKSMSLG